VVVGGVAFGEDVGEDADEHGEVEEVCGDLEVKVEKAVEGHGNKAAPGAGCHEEMPGVPEVPEKPPQSHEPAHEQVEPARGQKQEARPAGFNQKLQVVVVGRCEWKAGSSAHSPGTPVPRSRSFPGPRRTGAAE